MKEKIFELQYYIECCLEQMRKTKNLEHFEQLRIYLKGYIQEYLILNELKMKLNKSKKKKRKMAGS